MTESLISVIDRLVQFADYYLDHDEAPEANDPQLLHAYIRGCLSIPEEQVLPKSMIACFATIFLNNEALLYRGGSYAPENLLAIFRSAERHYPNDFADLVYRAVNARLHHRAVNEWVDHEDLRLEDMNWYQVAIALEIGAHRGFGAGGLADAVGGEELVPVHARVLVKAAMIAHWRGRMAGCSDGCWGAGVAAKIVLKMGKWMAGSGKLYLKDAAAFSPFCFFFALLFLLRSFYEKCAASLFPFGHYFDGCGLRNRFSRIR